MREIRDMDTRCALSITRQIANKSNVNEKCTRTRCLPWTYWIKGYTRLHIEQYDYFSPAAICIHTIYLRCCFLALFLALFCLFFEPICPRSLNSLSLLLAPIPLPCCPQSVSVWRSRLSSLYVSKCVYGVFNFVSAFYYTLNFFVSFDVSACDIHTRYTCIMYMCFVSPILVGWLVAYLLAC